MYKVSIVIPIYNAEKYLKESLDSIIDQTEKNLEIICINDGSTDGSAAIMNEYAANYNNIIVVHKNNSGYGDTVNQGIEIAHAKYIGILEPDDYISNDMYKKLYDMAEKYNLDWVKGNYACFWNDGKDRKVEKRRILENESYYNRIINPLEDKEIFRGNIMNPSGIYRKTFLDNNQIRHNTTPGASYQDLGFWFQIMTKSKKGMLLDDTFYFYRQDNNASSMNNRSKIYCVCDEYSYIRNRIDNIPKCILTQCMYATYSFTYKQRIAVEYRKEFLERYKKDFISLMENRLFDDSLLLDYEKEDLWLALNKTDDFYTESMVLSNELTRELKDKKSFLIYGAGFFAKYLYQEMTIELRENLKGFVVTDGNHEKMLLGKPIFDVNELVKEKYDVVIGVTEKYKDDVLKILENYETNSVIIINKGAG